MVIRKEFFKAFIQSFDPNAFPTEIDLTEICKKENITPKDLVAFN
jgi:hypothetical protein